MLRTCYSILFTTACPFFTLLLPPVTPVTIGAKFCKRVCLRVVKFEYPPTKFRPIRTPIRNKRPSLSDFMSERIPCVLPVRVLRIHIIHALGHDDGEGVALASTVDVGSPPQVVFLNGALVMGLGRGRRWTTVLVGKSRLHKVCKCWVRRYGGASPCVPHQNVGCQSNEAGGY